MQTGLLTGTKKITASLQNRSGAVSDCLRSGSGGVCPYSLCRGTMVASMAEAMRKPAEKRWIVLGEDGLLVTLGRHTDPTEAKTAAVPANLPAQGLAGRLAVLAGA
jgi:hypothetical protein